MREVFFVRAEAGAKERRGFFAEKHIFFSRTWERSAAGTPHGAKRTREKSASAARVKERRAF